MKFEPKTIFLCVLVTTSFATACSSLGSPPAQSSWNLQADAEFYRNHPDKSLGYKTLRAPMNFASLNDQYRSPAMLVSEVTAQCQSWIVLQRINLATQTISSKWLCDGGPMQGAGEFGVEDGVGFSRTVQVENMGGAVARTASEFSDALPIDYSRYGSLGASAVFITIRANGLIRRARYDANAGHFDTDFPESRGGTDTQFDAAYLHLLEVFDPKR